MVHQVYNTKKKRKQKKFEIHGKPCMRNIHLDQILSFATHKIKLDHFSIGPAPMILIFLYGQRQQPARSLVQIVVVLLRLLLSLNFAPNIIRFHGKLTKLMQRETVILKRKKNI